MSRQATGHFLGLGDSEVLEQRVVVSDLCAASGSGRVVATSGMRIWREDSDGSNRIQDYKRTEDRVGRAQLHDCGA